MNSENKSTAIKAQWNSLSQMPPELIGCTPLGGGGMIESPYRYYFETRHFKKRVKLDRSMNVLELGCGNGRWTVALAPLVKHYTGVDFSRDGLRVAESSALKYGLNNVEFVERSITDFEGTGTYDVIYFSGVSQYLHDEEMDRVLGQLASHMHDKTIIVDRSTVNYTARNVHDTDDYFCIYRTPEEVIGLFEKHGYSNTYQQHTYRYLRGGERLLNSWMGKWLPAATRLLKPVSLYLLLAMTWGLDTVRPPLIKGYHDFFIFKQTGK